MVGFNEVSYEMSSLRPSNCNDLHISGGITGILSGGIGAGSIGISSQSTTVITKPSVGVRLSSLAF